MPVCSAWNSHSTGPQCSVLVCHPFLRECGLSLITASMHAARNVCIGRLDVFCVCDSSRCSFALPMTRAHSYTRSERQHCAHSRRLQGLRGLRAPAAGCRRQQGWPKRGASSVVISSFCASVLFHPRSALLSESFCATFSCALPLFAIDRSCLSFGHASQLM